MARVSRPPGFDMTYKPTSRVSFSPPLGERWLTFTYLAFALLVSAAIAYGQVAPSSSVFFRYVVEGDQHRLVPSTACAIVLVVSALAAFIREQMRGVIVHPDGIELRELLSFGMPRVRRYAWAQIDRVFVPPSSAPAAAAKAPAIRLDLWDGTRTFLPHVRNESALGVLLERVALRARDPVRGRQRRARRPRQPARRRRLTSCAARVAVSCAPRAERGQDRHPSRVAREGARERRRSPRRARRRPGVEARAGRGGASVARRVQELPLEAFDTWSVAEPTRTPAFEQTLAPPPFFAEIPPPSATPRFDPPPLDIGLEGDDLEMPYGIPEPEAEPAPEPEPALERWVPERRAVEEPIDQDEGDSAIGRALELATRGAARRPGGEGRDLHGRGIRSSASAAPPRRRASPTSARTRRTPRTSAQSARLSRVTPRSRRTWPRASTSRRTLRRCRSGLRRSRRPLPRRRCRGAGVDGRFARRGRLARAVEASRSSSARRRSPSSPPSSPSGARSADARRIRCLPRRTWRPTSSIARTPSRRRRLLAVRRPRIPRPLRRPARPSQPRRPRAPRPRRRRGRPCPTRAASRPTRATCSSTGRRAAPCTRTESSSATQARGSSCRAAFRYVRLADSAPIAARSFPAWVGDGVSVMIPCRGATAAAP